MHKYDKQFNSTKSLYPKIFSIIKDLPVEFIYGKEYLPTLRHPGAILNRATHEIVEVFERILSKFNSVASPEILKDNSNHEIDNVLRLTESLFGHFDSFIDESFMILKSLCKPPSDDKGRSTKYVHEWLNLNHFSCGADFHSYTSNIKKYIDFFSNRLKHANQRLDGFVVDINDIIIPGFYIQEVRGKDFIEFYSSLPASKQEKVIAFSLNRTLKVLLLCFYEICDALEKTIKQHIKRLHGIKFDTKHTVVHDVKIKFILDKLSALGNSYYPYEFMKSVDIKKSGNIYHIKYPQKHKCPYSGSIQSRMMTKGDGYSTSFPLVFC